VEDFFIKEGVFEQVCLSKFERGISKSHRRNFRKKVLAMMVHQAPKKVSIDDYRVNIPSKGPNSGSFKKFYQ
jgi:hypothetical protein